MKINELKEQISKKSLSDDFMVWVLEDYSAEFIAIQYIKAIAEYKNKVIKYISSYDEIPDQQGFVEDDNLYIYKVDKLEQIIKHDNCITICNKTKYQDVTKIPKLEHWQFIDYLSTKVPGVSRSDLEWLITQYVVTDSRVTTTNYFRLDNDIDKISIFDESVQGQIFNFLYEHGEYDTTSNLTVFDLTTALVRRDVKGVLDVMEVLDYIDSKPHVWLLSILLNNFRNIISIQTYPRVTAEELGISDKQFFIIKKYNLNHYSEKDLIDIYQILTNVEWMYKFGGLNMDYLTDFMICKILGR